MLVQPLANAQPAPASIPAAATSAAQQADDLFLKGKALLKEGKKQEALAAYREAWKLRKSYDVAGNLGSLEIDLGLFRDAAEHLSYALSHYAASGTTKDQLDKARQRLDTARKEVCALRIAVNAGGAEVLLDGVSIGRAPFTEEVFVDAGARTIEARLAGHVTAVRKLDAKKGATEEVKLDLVPLAAATVTAAATTPPTGSPTVAPRSMVPAYVMGGVGVASLIAGGVLVGVAEGRRGEVRSKMPRDAGGTPLCGQSAPAGAAPGSVCDQLRSTAETANVLGNTGIAFFAIGGTVIAGAVAYWLWPVKSTAPAKASLILAPMIGSDGGGLQWRGSF